MKEPELGESNPLGNLYRKRVAENRDLTVLVADWNLERGSGKTTLALRMAAAMDRTEEGVTPDKATLSPEELTESYTREFANPRRGRGGDIEPAFDEWSERSAEEDRRDGESGREVPDTDLAGSSSGGSRHSEYVRHLGVRS